jgi:DNA-binding NarL/FixJ family response regulator
MHDIEHPTSVVIATDSELIGESLAALLDACADVELVGRAQSNEQLGELVAELTPDAVIISIRTSMTAADATSMATMEVARHLRLEFPSLAIVIISDRGNGFALDLLRSGSSRIAYLIDDPLLGLEGVLRVIAELRAGQTVLDPSIVDALVSRQRTGAPLGAKGDPVIGEVDGPNAGE